MSLNCCKHLLCLAVATLTLIATPESEGQTLLDGYLCCNMRSNSNGWISDTNTDDGSKHLLPLGTPVTMTGYGRNRFEFDVNANKLPRKNYWLGNDYSRELSNEVFSQRYVIKTNPILKLKRFNPKLRAAIRSSKVAVGMTREQVLMSWGYPIQSETPNLANSPWKFWPWSADETKVYFKGNLVNRIDTNPKTRAKLVAKL